MGDQNRNMLIFFLVVLNLKVWERDTGERTKGNKGMKWMKESKKGLKYEDTKEIISSLILMGPFC
jgi:hypothetical protein